MITPTVRSAAMFLFQTGSIKSPTFEEFSNAERQFLFQTGSIKSVMKVEASKAYDLGFYSKLVRLKDEVHFMDTTTKQSVSIPNWFD